MITDIKDFFSNLQNAHDLTIDRNPSHITCVSGFQRKIMGQIFPKNLKAVQSTVHAANKYRIPLYPVSTGKNWGFGGSLPAKDNAVILNLSEMNKIRQVNEEFGFAVIEPGVTQKQLSDFLSKSNSKYFVDVTGSGAETSIIGNALERGVAYNSLRVETLSHLEVVLGNGDTIQTGFQSRGDGAIMPHLYKYGIGPSLDGLFFQSNFGIVTAATIKLLPKARHAKSFFISIKEQENAFSLIDIFKKLKTEKIIQGIPHIFNRERLFPALAPLISNYFQSCNIQKSDEQILKILDAKFPGQWFAIGSFDGALPKKAISKHGHLIVIDKKTNFLSQFLKRLPGFTEEKALLHANEMLAGLTTGYPTNATLASVQWPITGSKIPRAAFNDPDSGSAGFLYCTPFAPLNSLSARTLVQITQFCGREFGFVPAISLNIIDERILEGVISVSYAKTHQDQIEKGHSCIRTMQDFFLKERCFLYRTNIDMMDQVSSPNTTYGQILCEIKKIFDPNNIIAPGRYVADREFNSSELK